MKLFVLPYKAGSQAVKQIKTRIAAKTIKLAGSRWRPKPTRAVINWGHTAPPLDIGNKVLNRPQQVAAAVNKLQAFTILKEAGVQVPTFTNSQQVSASWFAEKAKTIVFCRTLLRSSGGKGIVIAKSAADLVYAPLYTERIRKKDEFRVHVFGDQVIDVAEKRLKRGKATEENRNAFVRNHENGWIFAHENVVCPENVKNEALKAVRALGLDFGAVDVGVDKNGVAYVFEVNTAPGLENQQTIAAYVQAFNNYKKKEEEKEYVKPRAVFTRR